MPGFIRIPVCTLDMAYNAWSQDWPSTYKPYYPCLPNQGVSECGESTFVSATSDKSPQVSDCLQIVANIAGGGTWEVENGIGAQHQEVQYGTCRFGVQAKGKKSNVAFYLGNQDIMDCINRAVDLFASNGRVGAGGRMNCKGDTQVAQSVEWAIY